MRRLATLLMLVCLAAFVPAAQAMERAYGWCTQGGVRVYVSNVGSATQSPSFTPTYFQQSYPNCTVTVYLTGTTTPATLFSDNSSTPLSNPFTANSNGYWRFYAADGRYDVRFSGGGIPSPFTTADVQLCDPVSCGGGGGGGTQPHNLLSATHPDTVPYSPPAAGDLILGGIPSTGLWQRYAGNTTTTRKVLTQIGNGTSTLSQDWTTVDVDCTGTPNSFVSKFTINGSSTCAVATATNTLNVQWNAALVGTQPTINLVDGGGITWAVTNDNANSRVNIAATASVASTADYQHNNTLVGTQPAVNVIDTPSVTAVATNDVANNRVNYEFNAHTEVVPPPPLVIPIGQAVAWAYPTVCTPTGTVGLGSVQCGTTSGIVDRKVSCPLCDTNMGQTWSSFAMPTLPNDAVIQGIYGVMVSNRTTTPVAIMSLTCNATSFPVGGATTQWSGEFATITLGTATTVVTAGTCSVNSAANINLGTFGDDIVNTQLVAMAIYYTTATPPDQIALPIFQPAFYPSVGGVTPAFGTVTDGSPIAWDLTGQYIKNGFATLAHATTTRALNVSNMQNGGVYNFGYVEDSTGGATLTLGTGCTWYVNNVQTTTLGLLTTANAVQEFSWVYDGSRCWVDTTAGGSGGSGSGFAYLGAWSSATAYVTNNIVAFGGSSYIALTGNTNVTPGSDGGVTWAVLAAAGAQGPAGVNGIDGTNGTNGAPGAPGYSPNQILSGCGVAYTSGLSFSVSGCSYVIQNVTYGSPAATATLTTADATQDRIDVIAVNTAGATTVITGTPSTPPAPPSIDIQSQLQLTFAYVAAGATTPSNITTANLYINNAEWTCASTANFNCASTTNPFSSTLDIEATNAVATNNVRLTIPSGTVDTGDSNNLIIQIRSKATWPTGVGLTLQWYNGTTPKCTPVQLNNGNFGFSSNLTTGYQQVVIPLSTFSCAGVPVTQLRFTRTGTGSIGFYLDNIQLQGGVTASTGSASLRWQGAWSSSKAYVVNDTVTYQGLTYTAIQSSTNMTPSTNPTLWTQHSPSVPGVAGNLLYAVGSNNQMAALNSTISGSNLTLPGTISATQFISTDTVNNTQTTYLTGSSGDSTCPTPVAGSNFICTKSNALNLSNNGGAYSALSTSASSGNVTAAGTLTSNQIVIGQGTTAVATLGSLGTTTTVLHGNAGGAPTFGSVVPGDLSTAANTHGIGWRIGADNGSALVTADITPQKSLGQFIVTGTLTTIIVKADAGASTIQLAYRHTGSTTNYTAAVMTPATVGGIADKVVCANAAGTAINIDGVAVTCSTLATQTMTQGDSAETVGGTADGTTKRLEVTMIYTTN
jgi:hypothetical protein